MGDFNVSLGVILKSAFTNVELVKIVLSFIMVNSEDSWGFCLVV